MPKNFRINKESGINKFIDIPENKKEYFPKEKIGRKSNLYGLGMADIPSNTEKLLIMLDTASPEILETIIRYGNDNRIFWVYGIKQGASIKPGSVGSKNSDRTLVDRLFEHAITNNNGNSGMCLISLEMFDSKTEMVKREKELKEFFGDSYIFKNESYPITKSSKKAMQLILDLNYGRTPRVQDHRKNK